MPMIPPASCRSWLRFAALSTVALWPLGCHGGGEARFPLREALWRDPDARPFSVPCRKDEDGETVCMPEPYVSPLAWDAADNTIFLPVSRFFAVSRGGEAVNVNNFDEVPDSSWFTNRIGTGRLSRADLLRGACDPRERLEPKDADGAWLVDQGKPNGATPGFRVKVPDRGKFMIKVDTAKVSERASAASAIGARLYHAVGFFTPCENIYYVRPSLFRLKPGLMSTDNTGISRPFDREALDRVLEGGVWRGDEVRVGASQWLPNPTLGPFTYDGVREDDPNDVIAHEDRRELRGSRLLAAWINHFDSREQNTMTTWISAPGAEKTGSPGHIRHYYLDFSDSFGSEWEWDAISRRLGHSYYLDFGDLLEDFATFGLIERPWDTARKSPEAPLFNYFAAHDFDPEGWKPGYPNPAFGRMTEADGAWMARILARFTPEDVHELVKLGDFSEPAHAAYLERVLVLRLQLILRRYLARLSPLADPKIAGDRLCVLDLARKAGVFPPGRFGYRAFTGDLDGERTEPLEPEVRADATVCVSIPHRPALSGADDHPSRYRVVTLHNGVAPGPLQAHLYDLGPARGFALVGLVRPED